jgi:biotin carboxyl carrier protein
MKMQVRIDDQVFIVDVEDINARPVIARIEGENFEVWPEETEQISVDQKMVRADRAVTPIVATTPRESSQDGKALLAPLPGVIISIDVKVGDSVKQGQTLCTLEAMKMKNAVRATREGVISEIHINIGDLVKHGQLLISFTA